MRKGIVSTLQGMWYRFGFKSLADVNKNSDLYCVIAYLLVLGVLKVLYVSLICLGDLMLEV